MGMKSKIKFGKFAVELSTSGALVIGVAWFLIYYLVNGTIPEPSININFSAPIILSLYGGIGGNIKAVINRFLKPLR